MDAMGSFSEQFLSLVAEALGLERDLFAKYYEGSESASGTKRQDRLKIVRYPDATELKVEESDKALGGWCDYSRFSFSFKELKWQSVDIDVLTRCSWAT